jgi:myosin protein heavy chain
MAPNRNGGSRHGSDYKTGSQASSTFAPSFIKVEEMRRPEPVEGIEGENDFSGKRYVWLKDPESAFVKGWVVEELGNNHILVQCDDGSVGYGEPSHKRLQANPMLATRSQFG